MSKKRLAVLILSLILIAGCSTKKSTWLTRAYHNTTSKYNGYFNAREIMKEKEEELRVNYNDDYTQVLPIFIFPDEEKSQALYPPMDNVIDKCSEVIERHSIYLRKKEHINWIDDSYFLIGKARLYKHEFGLAEETFLYVYQGYKRIPERYKGLNWLIRTFIETEQYDKAEEFLDIGDDAKSKFPEEFKGHFNAIYADYFLKAEKNEEMAIEKLEDAIKLTKDRDIKRRYTFILAQLYENQRNYTLATERYSRVLKMRPDFTMRFNAKINRAILYDVTSADGSDIKKELYKMLKDIKNEDYKDQIYFALAEIALKEDDKPLAIEYLRKSVKFSVMNNRQKGLSYLKLAELYFEEPSYVKAQEHYDSTLQFLPEDHPEYYSTESKNNNLLDLVKNLKIIQLEDSLIALSKLSESDREKKVKDIIAALKEEEERKKQEEMRKLKEMQEGSQSNIINVSNVGRKGEWYFYNQTNMAMGQGDFTAIWGRRELEDNWRRKNKRSNFQANQDGGQDQVEGNDSLSTEDSLAEAMKYDPETYLKNIPKNIEEELAAHGRIAEALFNVGTIFKESFNDDNSAIDAFTRINKEYDTSRHNLPAHYQLYRIYSLNGAEEKAEIEKNWILDNHPFSEFAYLIKNPDHNKQKKASKDKIEEFYAATYDLYEYELYQDVIESCDKALEVFKNNHIEAKFAFLKAKSIGHLKNTEELKKELISIVEKYPDDPVHGKAKEILDYMKKMGGESKEEEKKEVVQFDYNPEEKHLMIISSANQNKAFVDLKNELADFNKEYFREQNLEVTSSALNENNLYLIRTFNTQKEAQRYFSAIKNNTKLMVLIKQANVKQYLISTPNFRTLFKTKQEGQYLEFFAQKYPS